MTILFKLMPLILIVTWSLSCAEKKTSVKPSHPSDIVQPSTTDSLKFTSGIRAIFQDSKGRYWFGSLQEGVAMYDGKSFRYFTHRDGLTDNQIHSIQEDKEGIIWLTTQKGLSSYDGIRITNHTNPITAPASSPFPIRNHAPVQGEWMKSEDDLWFGAGIKEGVFRYDGQTIHYLAFPPHQVLNLYDNLFSVTNISKGKNNMIWVGTYAGIFGYNGKDFTIINDETLGLNRAIEPLHIRSLLEDSKGRLWIGNNGIGVLLKEGDTILNFSEANNLIHPASGRKGDVSPPGTLEHVFTIAEDRQGTIWFGDRDAGIWKYDRTTLKNYTQKDGLTNDFALSIHEDGKGILWFGMADGTIYQFDGTTFKQPF